MAYVIIIGDIRYENTDIKRFIANIGYICLKVDRMRGNLRPARRLPPQGFDWEEEVKSILKAELKRRSCSYRDLADLLRDIGVETTEPTLRNKISRGNFNAVFFLQCLAAVGATSLHFGRDWEYEPGAHGTAVRMVRVRSGMDGEDD